MVLVAHEPIEILSPPKPPATSHTTIDVMSRGGFPGLYNCTHAMIGKLFGNYMNMVRHNAPRDKTVPLTVRLQECGLHELRMLWRTQQARAAAGIKQPIYMYGGGWSCGWWDRIRQTEDYVLDEASGVTVREVAARMPLKVRGGRTRRRGRRRSKGLLLQRVGGFCFVHDRVLTAGFALRKGETCVERPCLAPSPPWRSRASWLRNSLAPARLLR